MSDFKQCQCGCGESFPFSEKRKYFSNACRQRDYRNFKAKTVYDPNDFRTPAKKATETKQNKVAYRRCPICLNHFEINGFQGKKIYCSDACQQNAYNQRVSWRQSYQDEPQAIIPEQVDPMQVLRLQLEKAFEMQEKFDNTGE